MRARFIAEPLFADAAGFGARQYHPIPIPEIAASAL